MVFPFPTSPVTPPVRRAAPPARPHSFAGFRAQHHHYHQQLLRTSQQTATARHIRLSRLPDSVLCRVFQFVGPDQFASLASVSRRFRRLSEDASIWELKLRWLDYKGPPPSSTLFQNSVPTLVSLSLNDDEGFGDFVAGSSTTSNGLSINGQSGYLPTKSTTTSQLSRSSQVIIFDTDTSSRPSSSSNVNEDLLMVFDTEDDVGSSTLDPIRSHNSPIKNRALPSSSQTQTAKQRFIQLYSLLMPYLKSLYHHTTSSLLFTDPNLTHQNRAELLTTLKKFQSNPYLSPTKFYKNSKLSSNLQISIDFFESSLLTEFEKSDERNDEIGMKLAAELVWTLGSDGSSVIQAFVSRREIFYDTRFNPLDNLVRTETGNGQLADGVDFRPMKNYMRHVLESISREGSLIARVFPPQGNVLLYFVERIAIDVISEYITTLLSSAQSLPQPLFQLTTVAVYSQLRAAIEATVAIEPRNERVTTKSVEDIFNKMFEIHLGDYLQEEAEWTKEVLERLCAETIPTAGLKSSADAATLKRNVLGSLRDALLLPVSVVPKTVAYSFNALSTVGAGAFQTVTGGLITPVLPSSLMSPAPNSGYKDAQFLVDGHVPGNELESWLDEEDDAEDDGDGHKSAHVPTISIATDSTANESVVNDLRSMLSLDLCLKLIAANREALKRVESFESYTGFYGRKVHDLSDTTNKKKGKKVVKQNNSGEVAALVEYFELVQLADAIQQMVEAYYEAEMVTKIDRTDFLNAVVREKRSFEMGLDDGVAGGLNTSLGLLMSEVERLMVEAQTAVDYYPDLVIMGEGAEATREAQRAELEPTPACRAVIDCLDRHCSLLQGSGRADKQMMELFYQEVGLRLHGLICKHLKRVIVSIEGGFRLIADLNAYHQYVSCTFKSAYITAEFASLRVLGSLFIIDSPKLLAELARDVQRFGETFRAEDIYEFIKRRSDWKKIQKDVDRAMFGIGHDDCLIS
ncbi:hypothetical protein CROQUDRAFT_48442 [Cronartium quercuum f. sp. fusiforme G11]|uniref:F-box domain-containing protein n=1 Tax=Cronartium quercuum f. sp. fusiforme G11 TaxID=708437 RepID=A0A9P6NHJ3_9BASI|nr:hypothetical protein CROQUDRAFT_48442 [Cronartium quercuum f. sp. fusiforme G11]